MTPKQIKALRLSLGLSQENFGGKVGVSWTTINRWENGKSKPHKVFVKIMEGMK